MHYPKQKYFFLETKKKKKSRKARVYRLVGWMGVWRIISENFSKIKTFKNNYIHYQINSKIELTIVVIKKTLMLMLRKLWN